ncbi:chemotaxis protein CheB [Simiduia sp. 21SJ11W-1]|uniref:chemotaxis protein CheB n=1 Tax=Simiduia sp. 21SJ11W-1 TaxID=2909669 RepID=UPI00209CF118|nr:chemotaxis protein CheB [Simiduia sp. 21SJ11W-1]UTA48235.1 chemotaxis protein CheB [Simiduia sp. 21SJ11W-1]
MNALQGELRVGLLLEQAAQHTQYQALIAQNGCQLAATISCENIGSIAEVQADAWLIVADTAIENAAFTSWLAEVDVPVIFEEGAGQSHEGWQRRLSIKLQQLAGVINLGSHPVKPREVWVLAASTGGPAAVKQFLQALPEGLDVAFVYAQHIDGGFDVTLAQVISKGSAYPAVLAGHGSLVAANSVLIVRPDQRAEVQENGTLIVHNECWPGQYRPAINQVIANVAAIYGAHSGVIVFTGMGDDGSAALKMMKQQGGTVWAQTAETCTVSSMPDEAIATGTVSYTGSPEALAVKLAAHLGARH